MGYTVTSGPLEDCLRDILEKVKFSGKSPKSLRWLACLNPHSYVVSLKDKDFKQALTDADWLIPDGAGIVLASKCLGGNIEKRITGFDIFVGILGNLNAGREKRRVFFLGASDESLSRTVSKVCSEFPNIGVAGVYSPPFKNRFTWQDSKKMIAIVNNAKADVLWVGLGAPKQEKWIYENRNYLNVAFVAGVGAVFDFYSGRVKRPGRIFQICGLEWLPRLIREPKRLWRRTFISAPIFAFVLLRQFFKKFWARKR